MSVKVAKDDFGSSWQYDDEGKRQMMMASWETRFFPGVETLEKKRERERTKRVKISKRPEKRLKTVELKEYAASGKNRENGK